MLALRHRDDPDYTHVLDEKLRALVQDKHRWRAGAASRLVDSCSVADAGQSLTTAR